MDGKIFSFNKMMIIFHILLLPQPWRAMVWRLDYWGRRKTINIWCSHILWFFHHNWIVFDWWFDRSWNQNWHIWRYQVNFFFKHRIKSQQIEKLLDKQSNVITPQWLERSRAALLFLHRYSIVIVRKSFDSWDTFVPVEHWFIWNFYSYDKASHFLW